MKRLIALVMMMFVASSAVLAQGPLYDPVHFNDANLKAAVEAELRVEDPNLVDMLFLRTLYAYEENISDLTGLEYAPNLEELWLYENQISDISPLTGMTNLWQLLLYENQISNISPLAGLTNLERLWLQENQISDISPLAGLTNLERLSLSENQISDFSPLAGLTNLKGLVLNTNQISDITPLAGLTNLEVLRLGYNQISDISPLTGLTDLEYLNLDCNPLNLEAYETYIPQIWANGTEVDYLCSSVTDIIVTLPATSIDSTSATLIAEVDDEGGAAWWTVKFAYRRYLEGPLVWPPDYTDTVSGKGHGDFIAMTVDNLSPDTVYEFWAIAESFSLGTYEGAKLTFTTLPGEPEPDLVEVPDVVGMQWEDAADTIAATVFCFEFIEEYSYTVPEGHVISQTPAGGTWVEWDPLYVVYLTISLGPDPSGDTVVPGVVGMSKNDADSAITSAGLEVSHTYEYSDTVPEGYVISQTPVGGTMRPEGSTVQLFVSVGPPPHEAVQVPDVVGMQWQDAADTIASATGFCFEFIEEYSYTVPEGHVISQTPAGGTWVEWDPMYIVYLTISLGPPEPGPVVVPDVMGMTQDEAEAALAAVGLTVGRTYWGPSDLPEGTIIDQNPAAGKIVSQNSAVELTISQFDDDVRPESVLIYVSANAKGKNDGSSWTDAFVHLQDAITQSETGDEIRVGQGVYQPDLGANQTPGDRTATFRLKNGVKLMGGFAGSGQPDPGDRNIVAYETILSGDLAGNDAVIDDPCELLTEPTLAENSYHVVTAINCDQSTILDGLTITAGNANGIDNPANRGGGILNDPGSPTLTNCTFIRNAAEFFGGGIYNDYNSHSEPKLTQCTFTENAAGGNGGGMYSHATCNPTLIDCLFERNFSAGGGGAINGYRGASELTDCIFRDNVAQVGAAMHHLESDTSVVNCTFEGNVAMNDGGAVKDRTGVLSLKDCSFSGNFAGRGGAVSLWTGTTADVIRCRFTDNTAEVHGGAVYNNTAEPLFVDCSFIGNTAGGNGGGMLVAWCTMSVINCYFGGNTAVGNGGGVINHDSESLYFGNVFSANTAQVHGGGLCIWNCEKPSYSINCTFYGNVAEHLGGGIVDSNSVHTMSNCILWDNQAADGSQAALMNYALLTVNRCDVQDGESDVFVDDSLLKWGSSNIATDPSFVDADGPDNVPGTEDDRLDLLADSPCIDAGNDTYVPEDLVDLDEDGDIAERMPSDITGGPRFVDEPAVSDTGMADLPQYPAIVDIGAHEYPNVPSAIGSVGIGLVAHWKLDEAGGSVASDSAGIFDGVVHGNATWQPDGGVMGGALSLDGIDDYVTISGLSISGSDPRTIAGWVRATEMLIDPWTNVFGFTGPSSPGGYFDIELVGGTATTLFGYYGIHIYYWEQNLIPIDLEWHHFAATYDGSEAMWYADGELLGSETVAINTSNTFHIGKRADNDSYFAGMIDDVRIYDYALESDQIDYMAGL